MTDIIRLKAELLCLGMSVHPDTKAVLQKEYPHFYNKGFIDAVNLKVENATACVSIAEEYSLRSPYVLRKIDGQYYVLKNDERFKVEFFKELPTTNTVLDDLARLHADKCINIWPSTSCCFDTPESKCKFCSLECKNKAPIEAEVLSDAIKKLFEMIPHWTLNFSGGTYKSPDNMVDYWIEVTKGIRKFSSCPIAIEFAPPRDLTRLEKLKEAGANAVIMNLEIADTELRSKICPGKSSISYKHYHDALEKAVKVFGWGQVSSVLIGGIQPKEDIINECERLASMGVFPTIMPFRPMDNCDYSLLKPCSPDDLIEMSLKLGAMLIKYKLPPFMQEGCTKCGGCSIENDCYYKESKC
ncbi:MAG: hypothetical protein IKM06_02005 [Clostridia bacterium]|nr:hypothetical protein [Clostridia bacterium]